MFLLFQGGVPLQNQPDPTAAACDHSGSSTNPAEQPDPGAALGGQPGPSAAPIGLIAHASAGPTAGPTEPSAGPSPNPTAGPSANPTAGPSAASSARNSADPSESFSTDPNAGLSATLIEPSAGHSAGMVTGPSASSGAAPVPQPPLHTMPTPTQLPLASMGPSSRQGAQYRQSKLVGSLCQWCFRAKEAHCWQCHQGVQACCACTTHLQVCVCLCSAIALNVWQPKLITFTEWDPMYVLQRMISA